MGRSTPSRIARVGRESSRSKPALSSASVRPGLIYACGRTTDETRRHGGLASRSPARPRRCMTMPSCSVCSGRMPSYRWPGGNPRARLLWRHLPLKPPRLLQEPAKTRKCPSSALKRRESPDGACTVPGAHGDSKLLTASRHPPLVRSCIPAAPPRPRLQP